MNFPTVTCSNQEFVFLASLTGAERLVGVEDPFWGWLAEEVAEAWEEAKPGLLERGYVETDAEGRNVVADSIAPLMAACAFPSTVWSLSLFTPDGEKARHVFYIAPHLSVEQVVRDGSYELTALEDAEAVVRRVAVLTKVSERPSLSVRTGAVLAEALERVRGQVAAGVLDEAQIALMEAGMPAETAAVLVEDLAHHHLEAHLTVIFPEQPPGDTRLDILLGRLAVWNLRHFVRSGDEWVEIGLASVEETQEVIRRMIGYLPATAQPHVSEER